MSVRLEHVERKYGVVLGSVRDFILNYLPHQRQYSFLTLLLMMANMPEGADKVPEQQWLRACRTALDRSIATGTPHSVWLDIADHVACGWCVCPGMLWARSMRTFDPDIRWQATFRDLERLAERAQEFVAVSFHELQHAEMPRA